MIAATQRINDGENAAASGRSFARAQEASVEKSHGHGQVWWAWPSPCARVWLTALWTVCRFFGGGNLVNYSPALIGWLNGGCTGLLPAGCVHRVTWEFIQCWIIPNMSWLTIVATCSNFFKCNSGINIKKSSTYSKLYNRMHNSLTFSASLLQKNPKKTTQNFIRRL